MAHYQVIHQEVTVLDSGGGLVPQVFRVSAPTNKDPLAGGWSSPVFHRLIDSYPDGSDWVFSFMGGTGADFDVDLYVTCL